MAKLIETEFFKTQADKVRKRNEGIAKKAGEQIASRSGINPKDFPLKSVFDINKQAKLIPEKRKERHMTEARELAAEGRDEFGRLLPELRSDFQTAQHIRQGGQVEAARQQALRGAAQAGIVGSGLGQAQVG
jgi:hypothetical protein